MIRSGSTFRSAAIAAIGAFALAGCGRSEQASDQPSAAPQENTSMKLTSTALADGQTIPAEYTCDGVGRSPPLQWSEPPAGTQSFALVIEDPDAPSGMFRHWGVYDLPANARQLDTGAGEAGASDLKQTGNDFDKPGYGPPCPPKGDKPHHYHFRLMALNVAQLPGAPSKVKDILDESEGHVLGSAELVALYGRG
jgi:Raf kinase inhibitor-like YbhB/YbcL family protein